MIRLIPTACPVSNHACRWHLENLTILMSAIIVRITADDVLPVRVSCCCVALLDGVVAYPLAEQRVLPQLEPVEDLASPQRHGVRVALTRSHRERAAVALAHLHQRPGSLGQRISASLQTLGVFAHPVSKLRVDSRMGVRHEPPSIDRKVELHRHPAAANVAVGSNGLRQKTHSVADRRIAATVYSLVDGDHHL